MIIGLTGKKECGKDTAGRHLVHQHSFERVSFADDLKTALSILLDIPFMELEQHKSNPTVKLALGYENRPAEAPISAMWSPIVSYSIRHIMQRFGTEVGRNFFDEDFWVDRVLPYDHDNPSFAYRDRKIVVTDCRFENEAQRILDLGGKIVEIRRPTEHVDEHVSEAGIPDEMIEYVISNDSTIESLYKDVDAVLENIYANQ